MTIRHTAFQRRLLKKIILLMLALILILLLSGQSQARSVTVQLDHASIEMGDIINLIVQTDFQTFDSPDFDSLNDQFEVLGQQRSSQIQIVNGDYQAFSRWDLRLTPRHPGDLVIPPFNVDGAISDPMVLHVAEAPKDKQQPRGSSFLESSVNITAPYVQQEVLFTLRFYHLGQFLNGNIRPPSFNDAIIHRLRNQFNYQKRIGGKRYEVYEWTWAFFPQKSGTMVIPPQQFDGRIQYRGLLKRVEDETLPIELTVKPQPDSYPRQAAWLPAQAMTLTEDWQAPNPIRVGDSITRTFRLQATGLLASQLPEFQFKAESGFHLYPDQPDNENQVSEQGVTSQQLQKVAIVPTQAGDIVLPELTLNWWNTVENRLETLTLPAKTLSVLPAVNASDSNTSNPLSTEQAPANPAAVSHETTHQASNFATTSVSIWTLALLLLWLTTLGFALKWRNAWHQAINTAKVSASKNEEDSKTDSPASPSNLLKACQAPLDARELYRAVLHWQTQWQAQKDSASDSSHFPPGLAENIEQLKRHLYHQAPLDAIVMSAICDDIQQLTAKASTTKKVAVSSGKTLEPLYPNEP
ncbi:MAG: BatD family protein [Hydrogenovibrio sp.]